MNATELEELLVSVLTKLTKRQYRVLVVGFGSNQQEEQIFSLLKNQKGRCQYRFVFSNAYQTFFDQSKWQDLGPIISTFDGQLFEELQQTDLMLIPYMTRNSLTKIAVGMADNLPLTLVNQGLLMAKPILASNHCWITTNEYAAFREINQNVKMQQLYQGHEAQLKSLGIQSLPLSKWIVAFEQFLIGNSLDLVEQSARNLSKTVITLEDVKKNPLDYLDSSQKMTDLAREFLKEYAGDGRCK